jgi:mannosyltransferase
MATPAPTGPSSTPLGRSVVFVLAGILVVGAGLRFTGLGRESLWNDELERWLQASHATLRQTLQHGLDYDKHPPAYRAFLHYWERLAGDSEFSLRLPSALAGVLSILAMFGLGRRLYSVKEGLVAAALTAVLLPPVSYSRQAGPYVFLFLLSIVSAWLWLELLDRPDPPPWGLSAAGVVVALGLIYLHYYGVLLVLLQAAGALCLSRRPVARRVLLTVYVPVAVAYLPWLKYMWRDWTLRQGTEWIRPPADILQELRRYGQFAFNGSPALVALALLVGGWAAVRRPSANPRPGAEPSRGRSTALLVGWLVVPFLVVYALSLHVPVLVPRYLLVSVPAAYLLLSRAIIRSTPRQIGQAALASIVVAVCLAHLLLGVRYFSRPQHEQFRESVAWIVTHDATHRDSLIIGFSWGEEYFNYYLRRQGSDRRIDLLAGTTRDLSSVSRLLDLRNPRYVWFIRAHREPDLAFIEYLSRRLRLLERREFFRADVWLFENPL